MRSSYKTFSSDARTAEPKGSDLEMEFEAERPTLHPIEPSDFNKTADNKDWALLASEQWSGKRAHGLTYVGLFIFTFILYFRPYELIPGLEGVTSIAFITALATLLIFLPSQIGAEGSLTALPVEVKCVLFLCGWALITMPFARSPNLAWDAFNEHFSKVAVMFVVMVNALRSRARLKGLMIMGLAIGAWLSYDAVSLYRQGIFEVEGYRVKVDFGGMFGNPNDMAIHLVLFIPIAIGLGIASTNLISRVAYFASALLMTVAIFVTQSRGGFLGLVAVAAVLVWKLGKSKRFMVTAISLVVALAVSFLAPGNYGIRIMSIFIPGLDAAGSSGARWTLLTRSLLVSLRNPLGIGIGNFSIVGQHNQETHNSYTQVSAELGLLALVVYLIFLISSLRKLGALTRLTNRQKEHAWINTMSIAVYASIVGYMVSSFFGSVAYNWFVYYPIAFAVCLRRLYQVDERQHDFGNLPNSRSLPALRL